MAAGLQSGRGGLLSAGPGQRTADTAAALHRRSRHTPHPARVVTTARPGTRGTWPPVTGHVAARVCITPACLLPASPCLGPGPPTVAGGRAGRCRTTTCHRPPCNFQMICLLSTIFTIHKTDHNQFSSFYYWISRSAWSLIFNAMLLFLQYFCWLSLPWAMHVLHIKSMW